MSIGRCWLPSALLISLQIISLNLVAQNPVPLINQPLVPAAVAPGGARFTLTVNGTGFVPESVVNWNGSPRETTVVSSSQLTAAILDTDIAAPGTASVTVANPPTVGTSNVSNSAFLSIRVALPSATTTRNDIALAEGDSTAGTVAVGDFNGDGNLDLALPLAERGLIVLLGDGTGNFIPTGTTRPTGLFPQSVTAADFNGDGNLDLAVVNSCADPNAPNCSAFDYGSVTILLGNGTGDFTLASSPTVGSSASSLTTGDFNEDGNLDLAVSSVTSYILLGDGTGHFAPSPNGNYALYSACWGAPSVASGDLNGDGNLDLAFACQGAPDRTSIMLGDGTGNLASAPYPIVDPGQFSIVVADFNGDGKLDLAMGGGGWEGNLAILLGDGSGGFTKTSSVTTGGLVWSQAVGDFNGDGKLDLAILNDWINGTFEILLGDGSGNFSATAHPFTFSTALRPLSVAVGDFNGDGKLDFVIPGGNIVSILRQNPAVEAWPTSLTFETVAIGESSSSQPVILTNNTLSPTTISSINAHGDFTVTHNCPISPSALSSGANCAISVTFRPTADDVRDGDLTITDNTPGSPHIVSLTGTGLGPSATLTPITVSFPDQYVGTTGLPETILLTNDGHSELKISAMTASPDDFGVFNTCSSSVAPDVSCSIGAFFRPTEAGSRTGELIITDNAPGSPHKVTLTGVGTDFVISVSAGASPSQEVTSGQTATYILGLEPLSGFTGALSLTCSGAPLQSTCKVLPSSVTLNGTSSQTVTVSVATTAPSMSAPGGNLRRPLKVLWVLAWAGVAALVFSCSLGKLAMHRSILRLATALTLAAMLFGLMLWPACGGGGEPVIHNSGTPPGTYMLTVGGTITTTSGNLTRNLSLTLKVM